MILRTLILMNLLLVTFTVGAADLPLRFKLQGQDKKLELNNFELFDKPIAGNGTVTFLDGQKDAMLIPTVVKSEDTVLRHSFSNLPNVTVEHRLVPEYGFYIYEIKTSNLGNDEKWLEVSVKLPLGTNKFNFWNGRQYYKSPDKTILTEVLQFPLASVSYSNTLCGMAMGLDPRQMRCYFRTLADPATQSLTCSTRIVLSPGETDTLKLVIFGFKAPFAWRDAVQKYYDFFPAVYLPTAGTDPRIRKSCAQYLQMNLAPKDQALAFEYMRKSCCGQEWFYGMACGLRVGDWWPSRYTIGWQSKKKVYTTTDVEKRETKALKSIKAAEKDDIAVMAYTIPQFAEIALAREYFPEAILEPKDNKVRLIYDPWVYQDQASICIYTYGTGLWWRKTCDDLARYVKTYSISGFSIDCGINQEPHYGKGAQVTAGRSWSKGKGVYAMHGCSTLKVCEYMHTLKHGNLKMGTILNMGFAPAYFIWLAADAFINESEPQYRDIDYLRLFIGKKALTYWFCYRLPGWEGLNPNELKAALYGMIDYYILLNLKLGIYANPAYIIGVPKMLTYAPIITELIANEGWEPVSGMAVDDKLWHSRYGKGVGGCVFIGNPTMSTIKSPTVFHNEYLGSGSFAFAKYEGGELLNLFKAGKTEFRESFAPRRILIMRSVGCFEPGDGLSIQASFAGEIGNPLTVCLKVNSPDAKTTNLKLWQPRDYKMKSVSLNGQAVKLQPEMTKAGFAVNLKAGENIVTATFASEYEIADAAKILDYNFVQNLAPAVKVSIAKRDVPAAGIVANWPGWFFDVYYRYGKKQPLKSKFEVVEQGVNSGSFINVGTAAVPELARKLGSRKGLVKCENGGITIIGADGEALKNMMKILLSALEKKYVFYGYFTGTREINGYLNGDSPMAKKLGIAGSYLPYFKENK